MRQSRRSSGSGIWFTGLYTSGESTLALALEPHVTRAGYACFVLIDKHGAISGGIGLDAFNRQHYHFPNSEHTAHIGFSDGGNAASLHPP